MMHSQEMARIIGKYGCLAIANVRLLGYLLNKRLPEYAVLSLTARAALATNLFEHNMFIKDRLSFANVVLDLLKSKLKCISVVVHYMEPKDIKNRICIIKYVNGAHEHFVVSRNGVLYDPLTDSLTRTMGRPVEWRDYVLT